MKTYEIHTKLPTLNEYINIERTNKYAASSLKKKFTKVCALSSLVLKNKLDNTKTHSLVINWFVENNKVDSDNVFFGVKFILDGLVESGVLLNDSRKYITNIHNNIKTSTKYKIEVNLLENA